MKNTQQTSSSKEVKTTEQTQLTTFGDKRILNQLEKEIIAALQPVAEKYGITVQPNGGTYSDIDWTAKIKFMLPINSEAAQAEGLRNSELLGFKKNIVGMSFVYKGRTYTIQKINPGKKFAISTGDVAFGSDLVKTLLKQNPNY